MVTLFITERALVAGLSLVVLVLASRVTVEKAISLARTAGLTEEVIAVSVIGVGTSLPELGAHLSASTGILSGALDGTITSAAVLGGNMGSSTTQQFLLVGIFLLGYGRYRPTASFLNTTYVPMLAAFGLLFILAFDGHLSRPDGLVLVGAYAVYLYYTYKRRPRTTMFAEPPSDRPGLDLVVLIVGLIMVLGSAFVVIAAVGQIIDVLALSGSMVGVLTIGLAAALPELSTVVECLRRSAPAIALGALIGSNLVNLLLAIGLGGAISTYIVPPSLVWWDLPLKLIGGVLLLGALKYTDGELTREYGIGLVALYFVYLGGRLVLFPG